MKAQSGNTEDLKDIYSKAKALNTTNKVINIQDGTRQSALLLSIVKGNIEAAKFIIQNGRYKVQLTLCDLGIPEGKEGFRWGESVLNDVYLRYYSYILKVFM